MSIKDWPNSADETRNYTDEELKNWGDSVATLETGITTGALDSHLSRLSKAIVKRHLNVFPMKYEGKPPNPENVLGDSTGVRVAPTGGAFSPEGGMTSDGFVYNGMGYDKRDFIGQLIKCPMYNPENEENPKPGDTLRIIAINDSDVTAVATNKRNVDSDYQIVQLPFHTVSDIFGR